MKKLRGKLSISHFTGNAFLTDSGFSNALEVLAPFVAKDEPEGMQTLTITMSATLMRDMVVVYMRARGIKPNKGQVRLDG